jgi:hypothetical protein
MGLDLDDICPTYRQAPFYIGWVFWLCWSCHAALGGLTSFNKAAMRWLGVQALAGLAPLASMPWLRWRCCIFTGCARAKQPLSEVLIYGVLGHLVGLARVALVA